MCCVDTRMTLTEADVERLERAGAVEFYRQDRRGDLVLLNLEGRCVFLDDGRCGAYDVRPEGCRLYPLVLDIGRDRVVRDELCPHRGSFAFDADRTVRLRRSVECESVEAMERRRRISD